MADSGCRALGAHRTKDKGGRFPCRPLFSVTKNDQAFVIADDVLLKVFES